jgi:hypothetical protein
MHQKSAPSFFHGGIAGFPDIFQAKMSELTVVEFVRTYLDDLLCFTKDQDKPG